MIIGKKALPVILAAGLILLAHALDPTPTAVAREAQCHEPGRWTRSTGLGSALNS